MADGCKSSTPVTTDNTTWTDGESSTVNEARALRIVEIMNDFRTLQIHISTHLSRPHASPPNEVSYYEEGYVVLRQCSAESQAILATHFNPGSMGLQSGSIGEGEQEKATLQRIILDAASRRHQAHKIYLRASAGIRWATRRAAILRGDKPNAYNAAALRMTDERLREELSAISDDYVLSDLRGADRRAGHWVDEDPSIERMVSWIRTQR